MSYEERLTCTSHRIQISISYVTEREKKSKQNKVSTIKRMKNYKKEEIILTPTTHDDTLSVK